jgi:signal transduction histidine kinase
MNIRHRITLSFTLITGTTLLVFSLAIYYLSADYRKDEFYSRLHNRALSVAQILVRLEEVDKVLLQKIDKNTVPMLIEEQIVVYRTAPLEQVYASPDGQYQLQDTALVEKITTMGSLDYREGRKECLGLSYTHQTEQYVVLVSALDFYGMRKLNNLRSVLLVGCLSGIAILILGGSLFAQSAVGPLAQMNKEISTISAGSLNQRINEGNRQDEIEQLAVNFNAMLSRLQNAFENQRNFVSNAAHELRTPLTALSTQLQMAMERLEPGSEYQPVFRSLHEDTQSLIKLTNGLLTLAMSGIDPSNMTPEAYRVDEVLFNAQRELSRMQPSYRFQFEFDDFPEDEANLLLVGNPELLHTVFINFMENACKFSDDHTVRISLLADTHGVRIAFKDSGPGISAQDMGNIFAPFYRGESSKKVGIRGHGIGLSLCNTVVQLHGGSIHIESTIGTGSCFTVVLPRVITGQRLAAQVSNSP